MKIRGVVFLALIFGLCVPGFAQNLLTNPGFDTNLDGWTANEVPQHGTISWDSSDATGGTGSALLINTFDVDNNGIGLQQCIPVVEGEYYSYGAMLMIPSGQTETGYTAVAVHWNSNLSCTSSLGGPVATPYLQDPFDTWTLRQKTAVQAPAGAVAARVYVYTTKIEAGGSFETLADDMSFTLDHIFNDGFESGGLTAWSSWAP